jgi:hypothetical protein
MNAAMHTSREPPLAARERKHFQWPKTLAGHWSSSAVNVPSLSKLHHT